MAIKRRDFYHQGLKYSFHWEPDRVKEMIMLSKMHRFLFEYLSKVYKNQIPFDLFNDRTVDRISNFKIKGLPRGYLQVLSETLIESGYIIRTELGHSKFELSESVDKVYTNFKKEKIGKKPGHDPVLKYILIKCPNAIAVEVPIWKSKPKITGHMDLLLLDDKNLYIADYKPENRFLHSLPQVAFYGLLLSKKFNMTNIRCIQFSKDECWEYNPEILRSTIPDLLEEKVLKELLWPNFLSIC